MTTERLQDLIRAAPFRPFVPYLADGREIPVPHPEVIAHAPSSRIAVVTRPDDSFEVIDLLSVVGLESTLPASASSAAGGQQV